MDGFDPDDENSTLDSVQQRFVIMRTVFKGFDRITEKEYELVLGWVDCFRDLYRRHIISN